MDRTRRVDRVYRRVRALLQTEAIIAAPPSVADIRRCSAQHLLSSLSGLDAIVTDPPYLKDDLPIFTELAGLAKQALKPPGLLAVMCPHIHLPEILARVTPHIPYRWIIAYITPGSGADNWSRKVQIGWKPVVVFGGSADWIIDVVTSKASDKRFDDWGQSETGMEALIEALTKPGQLVCDPFVGTGTTAVACVRLKRRFIGCDVDAAMIRIARRRVAPPALRPARAPSSVAPEQRKYPETV